MSVPDVRDLVHRPEAKAVQGYFDGLNHRTLGWLLFCSIPGATVAAMVLRTSVPWMASLWAGLLVVALLAAYLRRSYPAAGWSRQVLLALALAHAIVLASAIPEAGASYGLSGFMLPTVGLLLRLRRSEHWGLAAVFFGGAVWASAFRSMTDGTAATIGSLVGAAVFGVAMAGAASRISQAVAERFTVEFRRELSRATEETRMRGELRDAREIQLSMLPTGAPALDWLEFDGLSLPAAEVGGDYFDYFVLDRDRLAVVVADVAGHGVASGIVLSGMRSGLYLLREDLASPVTVLERLNRSVRETSPRRMFVTLQIAVFDRVERSVTVASAGHPPLIRVPSGGKGELVGADGLPLGTRLEPTYVADRRELARGDLFLFYSDGAIEVANFRGEPYGDRRLLDATRRSAQGSSARAVRDGVVNNLWRFKGDGIQRDDLTLVVVRIGAL
jgi:serine phosphatase RsbU (regulator of sigma subunit)